MNRGNQDRQCYHSGDCEFAIVFLGFKMTMCDLEEAPLVDKVPIPNLANSRFVLKKRASDAAFQLTQFDTSAIMQLCLQTGILVD